MGLGPGGNSGDGLKAVWVDVGPRAFVYAPAWLDIRMMSVSMTESEPLQMRRNPAVSPEEIKEKMLRGLKESGSKLTPQRRAVVEVFARDATHPSAQDVFLQARRLAPGLSLSTVYYTIKLLKKLGLLKELDFYDMENRYEGNTSHHLNLVCLHCHRIEDYAAALPMGPERIADETGFRPTSARLEYYGLCRKCAKVKAEK